MDQPDLLSGLLVALQVVSTAFLWTLNPLAKRSELVFSLFIAVDLLAFAMVSQIYRGEKAAKPPSRGWLLLGSFVLILLLLLNFVAA